MTLEEIKNLREHYGEPRDEYPLQIYFYQVRKLLDAAERSITLEAENAKLKEQVRIMREALVKVDRFCAGEMYDFVGKIARQALEELK